MNVETDRKYYAAWCRALRRGRELSEFFPGVSSEDRTLLESRDMSTGGAYPGSPAGQFVPLEFNDLVASAMKDTGPMLRVATVQNTDTGAPRAYPSDNDSTIAGEQISEGQPSTSQDVPLSQIMLNAFIFSSRMVKASIGLVQDAGFDLPPYLAGRFGIRLARVVNPLFTSGSGSNQPTGFLTVAGSAGTAAGAGTNDGVSGANTLGTDDFATLELAVDPVYRRNAVYMMHPNTLASCRKVKDKEGHPVFPGLHWGGEDQINNRAVVTNPDMPQLQSSPGTPAVSRITVAFGDFSKYVIRRAPPIFLRIERRYVEYGQVAFLLMQRMDGNLIDGGGGAIKTLQNVY